MKAPGDCSTEKELLYVHTERVLGMGAGKWKKSKVAKQASL